MKYSVIDIAKIVNAHIIGEDPNKRTVRHISIDTRRIIYPSQSLFFALSGLKNDGHNYIEDAYKKGIRNFVVSQEPATLPDALYIKVADTLAALQSLATYHRQQFNKLDVIAITGSYGKTTVKEWVYQFLHKEFEVIKSPKSYNSQIGVALSLLQINATHEMALIEAGISEKGEMEKLEKMIQPSIGLLTNIGKAHSSGFSSENEKLIEKQLLFKNCQSIILASELLPKATNPKAAYLTWEYQIIEIKNSRGIVLLTIGQESYTLSFPFTDNASIQNAINAMSVAYHFGYDVEELMELVEDLTPVSMRLEIKKGINKSIIINDAYIADLDSLKIALDLQKKESGDKNRSVLLSDFQLAKDQKTGTYKEVQNLLNEFTIENIYTIGNDLKEYLSQSIHFNSKEEILKHFRENPLHNNSLLIKGSRKYQLELISDFLSNQVNETILEIDLTALAHNVATYYQILNPETEIIGVIKAGAYGSGSIKIAQALLQLNIKILAVAFTDEGIELRKAGINCPIIILNPQISTLGNIAAYQLEPEVYSPEQLKAISKTATEHAKLIGLHINLNTGMNRLGLEDEDIDEAIRIIKENPLLEIKSIFSHLSASDDPKYDAYSKEQFLKFETIAEKIRIEMPYPIMRHMLNSGGIPRFKSKQYEAVRLGIGMYGIDSTGKIEDLEKVHLLKSKIIQIKNYTEGTSIGYNCNYLTKGNIIVATIPIGYADGLPRSAGNGNYSVLIHDQLVPIIGNVCMDLIMVDITNVNDIDLGDEVVIFGKNHPLEGLATRCGTIPYEVLSNMSPRLRRIFIQE